VIAIAKALTRVGVPVWQYQFDYAPPGGAVSHAGEIGYPFNTPEDEQSRCRAVG
jgi:para-nitrobenzyl esterase